MLKGPVPYVLLAFLTVGAYLPALSAGYTNWDDPPAVIDNPLVASLTPANVAGMFYGPHAIVVGLYAPLTQLSFALDRAILGPGPAGHHVVNVLLHAGAGLLLFAFMRRYLRDSAAALLGAAVFLVHPAQVESVAWIAERKSVLSGLFIFAALLAYIRRTRPGPRSFALREEWPSLAFTLLALLSKPVAVVLPPILAALDLTRSPEEGRVERDWLFGRTVMRALLSKWPYFLLAGAASVATLWGHAHQGGFNAPSRAFVPTLATALSVVPEYARIALWPTNLSAHRVVAEQASVFDPAALFGLLVLLGAGVLAYRLARSSRVAPFFTVWVAAAFLPVSNIIPLDVYIAERYLYLPLAALGAGAASWLVPWAQRRGAARRQAATAAACAVIVLLTGLAFDRARVWRDSRTLWTDTLAKSPTSAKAHVNLGLVVMEGGDPEGAAAHFSEAVRLEGLADAWLNLGIALSRQERPEEALRAFEAARGVSRDLPDVDYWRGRMLRSLGNGVAAEAAYLEEIARRPAFTPAWIDLSLVQAGQGRVQDALVSIERAVAIDPGNPEALFNLGLLRLHVAGDRAGAREAFTRCIERAGASDLGRKAKGFLQNMDASEGAR
ncbi:MAG: tetratricopeptide repeat protein [Deltaproteobacteria bacterium]|nr:tetratricopeptide repeat protein [Deltaproteobacteria bacterium]